MNRKPTYEELEQRVKELEEDSFKRKQAEEAQQSEMEKLRALLDGLSRTNIGVDIVSIDYEILQQNQILSERFGNMVGKKCHKAYMSLEEPCDFCPMIKSIRKKRLERVELRASDGRDYELLSAPLTNPDGTVDRAIEVALDITDRKRDEVFVKEREQLYRALFENNHSVMLLIDPETGAIFDANPSACAYYGYSKEAFKKMKITEINILPEKEVFEGMRRAKREDRNYFNFRHRLSNGTIRDVEVFSGPITVGGNSLLCSIIHDISDRKLAEEALRESEARFRALSDATFEGIAFTEQGKIIDVNKQLADIIHYEVDELKGMDVKEMVMHEDLERVQHKIISNSEEPYEHRSICKDGTIIHVEVRPRMMLINGREVRVTAIRDITERKRAQEIMIQTEKMMSVGGLAAGMAHEINNPLAGILQTVQVMKNRMSHDLQKNRQTAEECGTSIETIEAYMEKRGLFRMIDSVMEAGKRAAKIVENMLSFSRKIDGTAALHDLSELMDKTVELAESDYGLKKKYDFRKIEINREYNQTMPQVKCEASKIQQVIFNILKNGAEMMSENKGEKEKPRFTLRLMPEDNIARIEIEDNGPGMDEATRKRVFEPFYTTKPVGAGTGLGLSVSYFIITENHHGTMEVESKPGEGTKFIIRLPLEKRVK